MPQATPTSISDILSVELRQVETAKQLESESNKLSSAKSVTNLERQDLQKQMVSKSSDYTQSQKQIVDNSSGIAAIAGDIDQAIRHQQQMVTRASGINVKAANTAEQFNTVARENYRQSVQDPNIQTSIDRYKSQVRVYEQELAKIQDENSTGGVFTRLGNAGRTGIIQKKLDQASANLARTQQRRIDATSMLVNEHQGNSLYANSSTAVERAVAADALVKADHTINILKSGLSVKDADRRKLQDLLGLDIASMKELETKYKFLEDNNLVTKSNIAGLQTKLYAQSIQKQALTAAKGSEERERLTSQYHSYLEDSIVDESQRAALKQSFPDPFSPNAIENSTVQTFFAVVGQQGTRYEQGITALAKDRMGQETSEVDKTALRLIKNLTASSRSALVAKFTAENKPTLKEGERAALESKFKSDLKAIESDTTKADLYTNYMVGLKENANVGIMSGAVLIPDLKQTLSSPDFEFTGDISTRFKELVQVDGFKEISLNFLEGVDPAKSLAGISDGVSEFLITNMSDKTGTVKFDESNTKLLSTVSNGLSDYYKVTRKMNNSMLNGLGSDVLPVINIVNAEGKKFNLENAAHWEILLRKAIMRKNPVSTSVIDNFAARGSF